MLELFGAKSGCSEAGERVQSAQAVLKVAADWDSLLASQLQVLEDAATLERRRAEPRIHQKPCGPYRPVRPGAPPQVLV